MKCLLCESEFLIYDNRVGNFNEIDHFYMCPNSCIIFYELSDHTITTFDLYPRDNIYINCRVIGESLEFWRRSENEIPESSS